MRKKNIWESQPHKCFIDEGRGYKCFVYVHPDMGKWCGHVELPEDHKSYGTLHGLVCEKLNIEYVIKECKKLAKYLKKEDQDFKKLVNSSEKSNIIKIKG